MEKGTLILTPMIDIDGGSNCLVGQVSKEVANLYGILDRHNMKQVENIYVWRETSVGPRGREKKCGICIVA